MGSPSLRLLSLLGLLTACAPNNPVVLPDMRRPSEGGVVGDGGGGGDDLTVLLGDKKVGDTCAENSDCMTGLCMPAVSGASRLCVANCANQSDCDKYPDFFCEPVTVGDAAGYCIPRSPAHCASCAKDSDCGALSELCFTAGGKDVPPTCRVDCSLSSSACPDDYDCKDVSDGGKARKLCMPRTGDCFAATTLGGFCDRVTLPQPCVRTAAAGKCTGVRNCDASKRYSACDAKEPKYKATCMETDPAGCMLSFDPMILLTPENCGGCGKTCMGIGQATSDVTCAKGGVCGMTCKGESYDVNNMVADGCEVPDPAPPGHDQGSAGSLGGHGCKDDDWKTFTGKIASDLRTHVPAIASYNNMTGAAPDVWKVKGEGSLWCTNGYHVEVTMQGGSPSCTYKVTIKTDVTEDSVMVPGNGTGKLESTSSSNQYDDGADIFFFVEKICSAAIREVASYSIKFHL